MNVGNHKCTPRSASIRRVRPFITKKPLVHTVIAGDSSVRAEENTKMFCGDDTGALLVKLLDATRDSKLRELANAGPSNVVVAGGRRMSERLASFAWTGRKSYEPYG